MWDNQNETQDNTFFNNYYQSTSEMKCATYDIVLANGKLKELTNESHWAIFRCVGRIAVGRKKPRYAYQFHFDARVAEGLCWYFFFLLWIVPFPYCTTPGILDTSKVIWHSPSPLEKKHYSPDSSLESCDLAMQIKLIFNIHLEK